MELLADRDPEEAWKLLEPVLARMMEAIHHYEGTVNQVMGDRIMALFGAPIEHEDHAVRACYAALRMQRRVNHYADELQQQGGTPVQIRAGLLRASAGPSQIGGRKDLGRRSLAPRGASRSRHRSALPSANRGVGSARQAD